MKRTISLRRRLLLLIVILWIVPVFLIYLFMTISYRNDIIEKTTALMEEGLKNYSYFNAQRIDEAINISKKTSYEQVIEKAWKKYAAGNIGKEEFYRQITGNLKSKFYIDNRFIISVFYLSEEPDRIYYTSRKESNYIDIYKTQVEEEAHRITNQDTSDAHVRVIEGRVYIIRNLYTTTKYTKFGTLVLELNKEKLIDGIFLNKEYELGFYINDTNSMISYQKKKKEEETKSIAQKISTYYSKDNNRKLSKVNDKPYTGMIYQQKFNDYHMGAVLIANENIIFAELRELYLVMFLILLIIIPVFIYMIYFLSHHITHPMDRMLSAVKKLEQGGLGEQMEGEQMPNAEFEVLMEAFNQMSSEVKYLVQVAYQEKLARKDAKIMALQSKINPHFLNNTLEMMNWQARMAGDVTVSKMIEALGTLLNYSMDRSDRKFIKLAEELRCVDAYCYIISMRFGKRLKIEKEVDNELLQISVPQLILQPLIENAVVHGVETVKSGTIQIKIFKEEKNVYLQIINSGKSLTKDDLLRIEEILNGSYEVTESEKSSHKSMGIRNVNERIKLIYGEEYRLTIKPLQEGETASTITVPYERAEEDNAKLNPIKIWNQLYQSQEIDAYKKG